MKDRFIQLIKDFCALSGIDDADHVLNGGGVAVNDIVFLLAYAGNLDPNRLFVRCSFGEIPRNREADALRALLEANLDLYEGSGPFFSLSPGTGRVVFTHSYRLDALTPDELQQILCALADGVLAWRTGYFLDSFRLHQNRRLAVTRMLVSNGSNQT